MSKRYKDQVAQGSYRLPMAVTIPSGKCPAKLESLDEEAVKAWIIEIVDKKPRGLGYETTAFKYFTRQFFDINKDEYRLACQVIDKVLGERTIFYSRDIPFYVEV